MIAKTLLQALEAEGAAALVRIEKARGSAPREVGAFMVLRPSGNFTGTIGGGALEWRALTIAKNMLVTSTNKQQRLTQVLGPDLGQCCGGRVELSFEIFDRQDIAVFKHQAEAEIPSLISVQLFGAGHIGRALILALAPLPFATQWIDSRQEAFPRYIPENVQCILSANPVQEIASATQATIVVIMTHDHSLDFDLVSAALNHPNIRFIAMIGSGTKKARFDLRLQAMFGDNIAKERFICPIGIEGIKDKTPGVIAASVAAQLLQFREIIDKESA